MKLNSSIRRDDWNDFRLYTEKHFRLYTESKLVYIFHHSFLLTFFSIDFALYYSMDHSIRVSFHLIIQVNFHDIFVILFNHLYISKKNFFLHFFFSSERSFHYWRKAYDCKKGNMSKKSCYNIKRNMCLKEKIIRKFERH